jgi:hypothetical protein
VRANPAGVVFVAPRCPIGSRKSLALLDYQDGVAVERIFGAARGGPFF